MEITIDRTKLWYSADGQGEPLVVTGGFGLGHHQFEKVTPYLTSKYRVINWDYQGTGFADRTVPEPNPVHQWVEQLRQLLEALEIPKISMWGTANGSLITLLFAARYPDMVNRIISHPWYKSDATVKRYFRVSADVVDIFGLEGFLRLSGTTMSLSDDFLYSAKGRDFDTWRRTAVQRSTSIENYLKICELLSSVDLTDDVSQIQAPTLLLMGTTGSLGKNPTVDSQSQYLMQHIHEWTGKAVRGEPIKVTPRGTMNHTYVLDTAAAICAVLDSSSLSHDIYNISQGYRVSVTELMETFRQVYPRTKFIEPIPAEFPIPGPGGYGQAAMDPKRLKEDLGFTPKYDLASGLDEYFKWREDARFFD